MPRFDVFTTPFSDERRHTPYWLDVQADHLSALETRVIVPLRRVTTASLAKRDLNPLLEVDGAAVYADAYADVANIAAFPRSRLKRPITNLRADRLVIEDALDFLFTDLSPPRPTTNHEHRL